MANVFTSATRYRKAGDGEAYTMASAELHAAVYALWEKAEADTLAAVGGLAALEQASKVGVA